MCNIIPPNSKPRPASTTDSMIKQGEPIIQGILDIHSTVSVPNVFWRYSEFIYGQDTSSPPLGLRM